MQSHQLAQGPIPSRCAAGDASGSEVDANAVLRSIGEAVYTWDMASDAIAWGDNVIDVLKLGSIVGIGTGQRYAEKLAPQSSSSRYTAVHNATGKDEGAGVPFQVVYGLTRPDRSVIWVEDTGRWFAGPEGRPRIVRGAVRLVTERHEEAQRRALESRFDRLTGALTRRALMEHIGRLAAARSRSPSSYAVLLAAIENLAFINQSHGYDIADGLLVDVVKRLRDHLRGTDVIARYNGNKFALVLDGCNRNQMEAAARRLLKAMDIAPIDTPAGPVQLLLRIGAVMDRHGARTPEMILKRAEAALEAAGESPGRRFAAYLPTVADARAQNAQIANDIVAALNERRVLLACQPIVASRHKEPVLYEALMRIRRDDGSLVLPDTVLPVAERTGLIRLVDQRVLELALAKLAENPRLTLAINVSAMTLHDFDWPARLAQAVALHPGTAERLIIELTETQAIDDVAATAQVIAELRTLGLRIAMDDFGAGHTSFKNLRQLKVDLLKIDGAFIRNLARSPDDRFFARTLIDLARHVGIPVVAEWVEDEESVRLLTGWGVDYLQGHYFGEASSMEQGFDLRQTTGR